MFNNPLKRLLPILAVVSALTAIICLVLLLFWLRSNLIDTGQTRPAVEAELAKLQSMHPASIDDVAFRQAVEQVSQTRYVAATWLFAPDGRIVYGPPMFMTRIRAENKIRAEELATNDILLVIKALPKETLSDEQQLLLFTWSAIRREGSHNDILRHLVQPVRTPDGSTVAVIGMAYDISEWVGSPGLVWKVTVLILAISLGVYWLSWPLWVLIDARQRGERALVWVAFVFIGNIVALIAYLLTRGSTKETSLVN
ncbi:MAG: hypothetical protein ACYTBV_10905 [Planctomycetota bacterium]|jgi:hypothetical protein